MTAVERPVTEGAGSRGDGKTPIIERSFEDMEREILGRRRRYEVLYEVSSAGMAQRQEDGSWPETRDVSEWMFWYRTLLELRPA